MNEKRTLRVFLGIVVGGPLIVVAMWIFFFTREINNPSLPVFGNVPDFSLTERSGRTVGLRDLLGFTWIADFIFTSCARECPMMSSNMKQLQNVLTESSGVRLVSISVDPARDTPAVLTDYAKRYNARQDRWWFLTGDPSAIQKLAKQGFFLDVAAGLDPKGSILHSQKFVLVDRRGRIRGFFDGVSPGVTRSLLVAIDSLEKEHR